MLLIIGTVRVAAAAIDAARPAMQHMIEATRAEPGCLDYSYSQDLLDPGLIHVVERWSDRAALEAHFVSPHIAEWRATWPALGIHDRALFLYEAGEPVAV